MFDRKINQSLRQTYYTTTNIISVNLIIQQFKKVPAKYTLSRHFFLKTNRLLEKLMTRKNTMFQDSVMRSYNILSIQWF